MRRPKALRLRLTLVVAAAAAVTMTVVALLVLAVVETQLRADARSEAATLLAQHLGTVEGGVATAGEIDPGQATSFFYLSADGADLSDESYVALLTGPEPVVLSDLIDTPGDVAVCDDCPEGAEPTAHGQGPVVETAVIVGGGPVDVDRGDEVIAVAERLEVGERTLVVGVSSPVQPIRNSVAALRLVLMAAVPLLTAAAAAIAWLVVGRSLRPVTAMAADAESITSEHLDRRVDADAGSRELDHLAGTVNGMLDRLESSQRRQRRFVSDAAHELRNPIATATTRLEIALAQSTDADWDRVGQIVLDEQHALASMVDDLLLLLARLDETDHSSTAPLDLAQMAAEEGLSDSLCKWP